MQNEHVCHWGVYQARGIEAASSWQWSTPKRIESSTLVYAPDRLLRPTEDVHAAKAAQLEAAARRTQLLTEDVHAASQLRGWAASACLR